jgi:hypothetical protein
MAYIVQTADEVEAYLLGLTDISDQGRRRVIEAYLRDRAEHADDYLKRAALAHESLTFQYDYVMRDGGTIFHFRFVVDGSSMPFGIVQVIYVDYERGTVIG